MDPVDQAKLELEKWRVEQDVKLRRDELEIRRVDQSKSIWSSPLFLAIVGLFASILVSIVQSYLESRATNNLERQKFESELVQNAVEIAKEGAEDQLAFKQDIADRLGFYLDLGLITDQNGKIASYVKAPESIPLQIGDFFAGSSRKAAKLSVGSGAVEEFSDLQELVASLPSDTSMASHDPPITASAESGRVAEEQRNVHFSGFLYAAKKTESNDYKLFVGLEPNAIPATYIAVVVSGLPLPGDPSYEQLKAARDACASFFGDALPANSYDFYDPPIPVEVTGSLFFNIGHWGGVKSGPRTLREGISTYWEIRPVTEIVFSP